MVGRSGGRRAREANAILDASAVSTHDPVYRRPRAPGPRHVVRHWPGSLALRVGLSVVFMSLFALGFLLVRQEMRTTLDCARADDRCTITHAFLGHPWTTASFALSDVTLVDVASVQVKGGPKYEVEVHTRQGVVELSARVDDEVRRQSQRQELQIFLDGRRRPSLSMVYDETRPLGVAFCFLYFAMWLGVTGLMWRRSTFVFDWGAGALVVEHTRWPWPVKTRRAFELARVVSARAEARPRRRRPYFVVAIVEAEGAAPLAETMAEESVCVATVERLNAELATKGRAG